MQFEGLEGRLADIRGRIDAAVARGGRRQRVEIVAVTKTHGPGALMAAWRAGLADVGENRVQEALEKMEQVAVPVRWHLIGHLQRNKARSATRFALVHSVDSARLADALQQEAAKAGVRLPVLLQVNTSGESSKGGYRPAELAGEAARLRSHDALAVRGVMTMAPLDAPEPVLRAAFGGAREANEVLQQAGHEALELSMGMSNDYEVAVEEGATLVRLGTILFGVRLP